MLLSCNLCIVYSPISWYGCKPHFLVVFKVFGRKRNSGTTRREKTFLTRVFYIKFFFFSSSHCCFLNHWNFQLIFKQMFHGQNPPAEWLMGPRANHPNQAERKRCKPTAPRSSDSGWKRSSHERKAACAFTESDEKESKGETSFKLPFEYFWTCYE